MRRREFITLLGGAVTAWPSVARAQQREQLRRIGVLLPTTADDPVFQDRVGAFLQGLGSVLNKDSQTGSIVIQASE